MFRSSSADIGETNRLFQKRVKDIARSALCNNMSTGFVGIYKVKRSHRHHLAAIENNRLVSPIVMRRSTGSSSKI